MSSSTPNIEGMMTHNMADMGNSFKVFIVYVILYSSGFIDLPNLLVEAEACTKHKFEDSI